jgi:hypothetical protein
VANPADRIGEQDFDRDAALACAAHGEIEQLGIGSEEPGGGVEDGQVLGHGLSL